MQTINFVVSVTCQTLEQAMEVMAHRMGHDEEYGFDYSLDWTYANWIEVDAGDSTEEDVETGLGKQEGELS